MEELADLEFWSSAGIFSANDRRRMLDVEYVSELAVAALNGLQNKKRNLEEFYQQYETKFDGSQELRDVFLKVIGEIGQLLPDIAKTRWKKKSDFYTLFLKFARHAPTLPLSADNRAEVARILVEISNTVDAAIAERIEVASTDEYIQSYIRNVERAASDLGSRKAREISLDNKLASIFAPVS
jgi:hypothetical protein